MPCMWNPNPKNNVCAPTSWTCGCVPCCQNLFMFATSSRNLLVKSQVFLSNYPFFGHIPTAFMKSLRKWQTRLQRRGPVCKPYSSSILMNTWKYKQPITFWALFSVKTPVSPRKCKIEPAKIHKHQKFCRAKKEIQELLHVMGRLVSPIFWGVPLNCRVAEWCATICWILQVPPWNEVIAVGKSTGWNTIHSTLEMCREKLQSAGMEGNELQGPWREIWHDSVGGNHSRCLSYGKFMA